MHTPVDVDHIAEWLSRLVQIPSVSPLQAGPKAGVAGEAKIAEAIAGWFSDFGGTVEIEEVSPGRPNVYGMWRGKSDRWIAVDAHTDTVSVEQMTTEPFDGTIKDGRVYGRGSVDTKATMAIVLSLLEYMSKTGQQPEDNIFIVGTADEETGQSGARALGQWVKQKGLKLDQLIIAEPTMCVPVYGHKGGVMMQFEVHGRPAHTSKPHLGKNAINAAAHLVVALENENERLQTLTPETPLGNPTLTVSMIQGGLGSNIVPDSCLVSLGRRGVPGEDPQAVIDHLTELAKASCPLPLSMLRARGAPALYQPPDSEWIKKLAAWSGQEPDTAPYGTNALSYPGLASEMVVLGPGSIDQAHGEVEWVEISELAKAAEIYSRWWQL